MKCRLLILSQLTHSEGQQRSLVIQIGVEVGRAFARVRKGSIPGNYYTVWFIECIVVYCELEYCELNVDYEMNTFFLGLKGDCN